MELMLGAGVFGMVVCLAIAFMAVSIFNGLVGLKTQAERSWANIDVILKQRHDEIPNLVSICEQFAGYERATLDRLVEARTRYSGARTMSEKVKAANDVSGALANILAIGEAYPQLRSSEHFSRLQERISGLEDAIADRREHFNETVTNFNTRIQQFPDLFFARILGYIPLDLFKVAEAERAMPSVKMKLPAA